MGSEPRSAHVVHYVGFTRTPDTRALNGAHKGLTRTLYRTRDGGRDIFVFYNTFGVTADVEDPERHVRYLASNAMTDEVNIDDEGLILETALIQYFKPDCQGNQRREEGRLRNLLAGIERHRHIERVRVTMEFAETSEYYSFCSDAVPPALSHTFQVARPA